MHAYDTPLKGSTTPWLKPRLVLLVSHILQMFILLLETLEIWINCDALWRFMRIKSRAGCFPQLMSFYFIQISYVCFRMHAPPPFFSIASHKIKTSIKCWIWKGDKLVWLPIAQKWNKKWEKMQQCAKVKYNMYCNEKWNM